MSTEYAQRIPETPEESGRLLDKVVPPPHRPPLLYRAMAANPAVLRAYVEGPILGLRGLLHTGQLAPDERELCILRVTARCGAEHEWGVHVAYFGKTSGLSPVQVAATVLGEDADQPWSPRQRAIVALADAMVDMRELSDAELAGIDQVLTVETRTEVVAISAQYLGISATCRALDIPPEPGAPRFPVAAG
ncbi:carboxymuconolactone decarboxylase family protein [Gordonia sp. VNK21]|uniref:carboxymuconolactone decarboxylase family protein n=1 Tax=Gordonia sp. VNK21 TaxID=3382483 RepID=UPI0038D510CD